MFGDKHQALRLTTPRALGDIGIGGTRFVDNADLAPQPTVDKSPIQGLDVEWWPLEIAPPRGRHLMSPTSAGVLQTGRDPVDGEQQQTLGTFVLVVVGDARAQCFERT